MYIYIYIFVPKNCKILVCFHALPSSGGKVAKLTQKKFHQKHTRGFRLVAE